MATGRCSAVEPEVQTFQLTLEGLQLGNALLGISEFVGNGRPEAGKISCGLTWLPHQLSDLSKRQSEGLGPLNKPKSSEGVCSI